MVVLMCPPIGVNTAQGRWLKGPGLRRAWGGWGGGAVCARLCESPMAEPVNGLGSPRGLSLGLCWLQGQLLGALSGLPFLGEPRPQEARGRGRRVSWRTRPACLACRGG